jgi:heptosyltransferase-2
MESILIIKTGAAGDVVRTTSLLNVLQGNIYWVAAEESIPVLPDDRHDLKILSAGEAFRSLGGMRFTQVISLEENEGCARLASEVNAEGITGIYSRNGSIAYTDDSSHWFDMSRISRLGPGKANKLKAENELTYQHHIFKMIGKKFSGEPYRIYTPDLENNKAGPIGIEKRVGKDWPDKQWWGYDKLIDQLRSEGRDVRVFQQRDNIRDYLRDIATCRHVVSGDTLAMHAALAYGIPCTAIFNCTSPREIFDYGLLSKVISPLLKDYFYSTTTDREVIESVPFEEVYELIG